MADNSLAVTIGDVTYRNPIFAASTPATGNLDQWQALWDKGIGAIVVKTVTDKSGGGENNQRAIWTDDRTSVFNQGSTAKEMPPLEEAVKEMAKGIERKFALIPSLASKAIYDWRYAYNAHTFSEFTQNLTDILLTPRNKPGLRSIFDKRALQELEDKYMPYRIPNGRREDFIKHQLVGLADIEIWDKMFRAISSLKEHTSGGKLNVELNLRYYMRSLSRLSMPTRFLHNGFPIGPEDEEYERDASEYFTASTFSGAFGDMDDFSNFRNSALHRTLSMLSILGDKYDIGLIAKFPFRTDLIDLCETCSNAGYSAVTLINTFKSPPRAEYFTENKFPAMHQSKEMQLSGEYLRELSRTAIANVAKRVSIPILASGGVAMDMQRHDDYMTNTENIKQMHRVIDRLGGKEGINELLGLSDPESGSLQLTESQTLDSFLDAINKIEENKPEWIKSKDERGNPEQRYRNGLKNLRKAINTYEAVEDIWDRILLGADAVQLGSVLLGEDGFTKAGILVDNIQAKFKHFIDGYKLYMMNKRFDEKGNSTKIGPERLEEFKRYATMYKPIYDAIEMNMKFSKEGTAFRDTRITPDMQLRTDEAANTDYMNRIKEIHDFMMRNEPDVMLQRIEELRLGIVRGILSGFLLRHENIYQPVIAEFNPIECVVYKPDPNRGTCGGDCYTTNYCNAIWPEKKETSNGSNKKLPTIDNEACTGCGTCMQFCDYDAIKMIPRPSTQK